MPRPRLVLETGAFDTDDGLIVRVTGEPFPRVVVGVNGIRMSDGQTEPQAILGPDDVAALIDFVQTVAIRILPEFPTEDGEYTLRFSVPPPPPDEENVNQPALRWVPL